MMGRIYRHIYTTVNSQGRRVKRRTKNYYYDYKDEFGKWHRHCPGHKDLLSTQRLLTDVEAGVLRAVRGELPAAERPERKPVAEHLAEYSQHLAAKGDTPRHVLRTRTKITRLLDSLGITHLPEISRGRVENWLAAQRHSGKLSGATSNHYARAAKGFTRWLVAEGRLAADPLAGLRLVNAEVDRRRTRRALTAAEFSRLLAATAAGKPYKGIRGPDRRILYLLAAYTGLRRSELLSLTPAAFALESKPPTVTVEAVHSKRRRRDVLPIPGWLAAELRPWLRRRPPDKSLWPGRSWLRTAAMLARDMLAAKIPAVDDKGRVFDFHALRSQFITGLARAGVPLATAQKLARHSTPMLTAKAYTHLELDDLAKAAAKLPRPK